MKMIDKYRNGDEREECEKSEVKMSVDETIG